MKPFNLDKEQKIKSGFTAPEGYFDAFTEKMMQQLPEKEVKVIPIYKRASVWISSVAAVLVIALGLTITLKNQAAEVQPDSTAIENYLAYEADTYEIIQELDQADINELEASIAVNNEAIENYFSNENYDVYLNE